ncbi:MAG: 6-bladed beta-propeller [Betaproteobacteria bacterium]|nr:6-bladed beta-propeller [Betaproteobacteria bacterium]
MAPGRHRIEYEVIEGWEQMPEGWAFVEVAGVACDSQDRVYVFNRGTHPMIVFDKEGKFFNAWGEPGRGPGQFILPHGIWADRRGDLYVGEVVVQAGAVKRMAPLRPAAFQKFRRRAG